MTDVPPEPDDDYRAKVATSQERRKREIADITFFIIDRTDAAFDLEFKTLHRLDDRDLSWLAAAIANC